MGKKNRQNSRLFNCDKNGTNVEQPTKEDFHNKFHGFH